jgi:hypothetical protein
MAFSSLYYSIFFTSSILQIADYFSKEYYQIASIWMFVLLRYMIDGHLMQSIIQSECIGRLSVNVNFCSFVKNVHDQASLLMR